MHIIYIYPMLAMVLLTFLVAVIMLYRRVQTIKSGEVDALRYKTLSNDRAPAFLLQAERHFINLFEVPVLFYAACTVAMILPLRNEIGIYVAWSFVFFRVLQAIIHLWPNKIMYRMTAFLLGFLSVLILWALLGLQAYDVSKSRNQPLKIDFRNLPQLNMNPNRPLREIQPSRPIDPDALRNAMQRYQLRNTKQNPPGDKKADPIKK